MTSNHLSRGDSAILNRRDCQRLKSEEQRIHLYTRCNVLYRIYRGKHVSQRGKDLSTFLNFTITRGMRKGCETAAMTAKSKVKTRLSNFETLDFRQSKESRSFPSRFHREYSKSDVSAIRISMQWLSYQFDNLAEQGRLLEMFP